jgi:hypothetical protein
MTETTTFNLCCALNAATECVFCRARFCSICRYDPNHSIEAFVTLPYKTRAKVQVRCKNTDRLCMLVPLMR